MNRIAPWIMALMVGLSPLGLQAQPKDIAGIKLDNPVEVAGSKLALNGAGVRYKAVFPVYVAGLYLSQKAGTPEEVLAAPGPKRISITMLRSIDSAELGKLFVRGVEDNSPKSEMSKLVPGLMRMSQIFYDQKTLSKGDTFMIDWIPGTGTVLIIKGETTEPFREPEFFQTLMRIWLGSKPADWQLKEALLGKT